MNNKIEERTFAFALDIIELYKFLVSNNEYVLSKQLLRSGTSVGANVQEAQAAQSKNDFISKMSISSKEARETKYWIRLLNESGYLGSYEKTDKVIKDIDSIINILSKIIITVKNNNG